MFNRKTRMGGNKCNNFHWLLEGGYWQLNRPQRKEYRETDDTCGREDRGKRRAKLGKKNSKKRRTGCRTRDRRCGRRPALRTETLLTGEGTSSSLSRERPAQQHRQQLRALKADPPSTPRAFTVIGTCRILQRSREDQKESAKSDSPPPTGPRFL